MRLTGRAAIGVPVIVGNLEEEKETVVLSQALAAQTPLQRYARIEAIARMIPLMASGEASDYIVDGGEVM